MKQLPTCKPSLCLQQSCAGTRNIQGCQRGPEAQHAGQINGLWPCGHRPTCRSHIWSSKNVSPLCRSAMAAASLPPPRHPRLTQGSSPRRARRAGGRAWTRISLTTRYSAASAGALKPASQIAQSSSAAKRLDWLLGSPDLGPSRSFLRHAKLSLQQAAVI